MALVEAESPPGTAATTQTADGHRMRPVSPCGPPRLAMWRFGCPMIRSDAGSTSGAQSAAARARTECCPRKSPRTRFFSHTRPSYNRGPGFESPKSIRNDESEGSGGQIFRCATSLWRCAPALARTYGGGTTSAGRCRVHGTRSARRAPRRRAPTTAAAVLCAGGLDR